MTDQLTNALTLSCFALLGLLLWVFCIVFVMRDVKRRDLPGYEQAAWLVLAVLLPVIGGIAYLFARFLDRIFSPSAAKKSNPKKRITAYKNPDKPARRLPTIAAVDTYRPTLANLNLSADAGLAKGKRSSIYLEIQAGPIVGLKFYIETLPVCIGRGPQAALSLDADQGISRQHAEIYEKTGHLRIRDLKSTHGTYLNGKRISDESLNLGDHLSIGLSTLVLLVEDQDAAS